MIQIINGPNLNLVGKREPDVYGSLDFETFLRGLRERFPEIPIGYYQSNIEGELVDTIQKWGYDPDCRGIILNPGGYSHYSVAIADAVAAVPARVVEVHISNIHGREAFRHNSVTASQASGVIAGFGLDGYRLAAQAIIEGDIK